MSKGAVSNARASNYSRRCQECRRDCEGGRSELQNHRQESMGIISSGRVVQGKLINRVRPGQDRFLNRARAMKDFGLRLRRQSDGNVVDLTDSFIFNKSIPNIM